MTGAIPITGPQTDRARIAPLPVWVVHEPYEAPSQPEEVFGANGCATLLEDTQVNLTGPQRALHCRIAERVTSYAGAEHAAQFSVPFDPIGETLDIHFVRVIRGGSVVDHARPEAFEILRRERSLERLVFDGRLTVHLIIPDVRPGDIVESAYTITGGSPLHGNKYATWVWFEWSQAKMETRHRLLAPKGRPVAVRSINNAPEPIVTETDAEIDTRWRAVRRPPVVADPAAPPWRLHRAAVQVSEFASWDEVATMEAALYTHDGPLPDEIEAAIAAIAERAHEPGPRAAEALRFVQSNLRYLALAMGEEGRLAPRSIEAIWQSRFGDCKDKARLLVAMARRLGLDACPALVNTTYGEGLAHWLPTPSAFDHVLVRVDLGGEAHWLDPTHPVQAGRFERLGRPYWGWALPLRPGQSGLEHMGAPTAGPAVDVEEKVQLGPRPSSPARYDWRVIYHGAKADEWRAQIAAEGLQRLGRAYLHRLQAMWPGVAPIEHPIAEDDAEENCLVTTKSYEMPVAWRRLSSERIEFWTQDFFLAGDLPDLSPGFRSEEIYVGPPRVLTRRVEIALPAPWMRDGWEHAVAAPGIVFVSKLSAPSKRRLLLEQRLEVTAECVPGSAAEQYRAVVEAMHQAADVRLSTYFSGDRFMRSSRRHRSRDMIRLLLALWAVLMAVAWFSHWGR